MCLGCAGYRVGNVTLYNPEIRTIYVPVFDSDSYRRYLGEQLTEAVIKEIELRTPYKVVGRPPADSILTGRIVEEGRSTVIPSRVGGPRQSTVRLVVEVAWLDNRGNLLGESGPIPLPTGTEMITETVEMFPEYGQSTTTAYQQLFQRVAQQIVGMMEQPW
ncbi:MAG: LPS assembly lipoprotein LptE [Thermoguttaceae bacterium]|nr:LPS assembly lipoprotein LptE [Thermoguttaceae bacterium]MDW8036656.1 LptE family protein [Thermoguttaceae bacterium]